MKISFNKIKELNNTVKPVKNYLPRFKIRRIPDKLENTDIKKKYIVIGTLYSVIPFAVSSIVSVYNEIMSKGKKK